ncbi:2',3'-cyclic-nucleotide 2'-phosphodiesterase (5'-nucleotidase family) [Arthrobacter ginsengisoli]|uniref:2',3'-cyclic-nucleotide 2'-phosphodiesterase (5'-nucleotidase family) n=1 Tax=Arthrobacter ginsengisoli TaxID=1356565 RepID=A0ABU1UHR0_9MICC|nr:5'-nucleotidase [Arthrobacter ginsengisoli]MDR7084712.1 2',3'-cyclic-nucleotide 2'-phosphodiesterase (5'-nucleotidase family) [Arthrobacter ginsengisoli]
MRDDGRLILSPEGNMGSVLRLDITLKDGETVLTHDEFQVDASVVPDAGLAEVEAYYVADMDDKLNEQIGKSTGYLDRVAVGNLAADAFRAYGAADFGWMNGGGARADIPGPPVTLRDAYSVLPFGNRVSVIEVTGEQLRTGLEFSGGDRTRPAGFGYTYTASAPEGSRISDLHTTEGPVDPAGTYTLAITSFVAQGNPAFKNAPVNLSAEDGTVDVSALIDHIKAVGTLSPDAQPRVTVQ